MNKRSPRGDRFVYDGGNATSPWPMTITYDTFATKYGGRLPNLTEAQFLVFLPDALAEISLNNWGVLADKATELLIGHYVELSDASSASASAIASVKVEGEIALTYTDNSKLVGYSTTWFGKEYERLLGQIGGGAGKVATAHFGGNRVDAKPQVWG